MTEGGSRFSPKLLPPLAAAAVVAGGAALRWGDVPLALALVLAGAAGAYAAARAWLAHKARQEARQADLDERLLQAQKMAAVGELAAGIAHEINNPLAIILQEVEWLNRLLKGDGPRSPEEWGELRDSLGAIAGQVDRGRDIIRRLLDFARKREPIIQAVDLNKLVADMSALVEREARRHGIVLQRQFAAHLPPIQSDPPLLRQVVLNLLTNAVYAIGRDGVITITTAAREGREVEIAVADTGCGIPPEHLDKIFDPFFTTKPPGRGTGLGLAISRQIIHSLGGAMEVTGSPGRGATFTLRLPRQPEGRGRSAAGGPGGQRSPTPAPGSAKESP